MPTCEVCGLESQGYHFGVLTCRACSAFFRRAATSKWSTMGCQSKKCENGQGKYCCKPCRLRRCYDVGMNPEKFQYDRDTLCLPGTSKSKTKALPQSFEMFVGRPEYVLFCTPGTSAQISYPKTFIDVTYLVDRASRILEYGAERPLVARDQLQKLASGFSFLGNTSTEMKTFPHSSKEDVIKIWEFYFLTVAKWLTYFDEFQRQDHDVKMQILLATWHVWGRLDKLMSTAINRRRDLCPTKNLLTLSNGVLIDVDTQQVDVGWMTNYQPEQVLTFIDGVRARELISDIDPLVDLEPSDVETAYLLAQLCFHYAAKRFSGTKIEQICDSFQEILASNLHDYYVNDKKVTRYSGRLAKLMKVNSAIQKNIWENRSKIDISKTFDMLTIEISHPEMFYDTGF